MGSVPSALIDQICGQPVRLDTNASLVPSGDHAGRILVPANVSCVEVFPSSAVVQISGEPPLRETKANVFPSGDHAGKKLPLDELVTCFRPEPSPLTVKICEPVTSGPGPPSR